VGGGGIGGGAALTPALAILVPETPFLYFRYFSFKP